MAGPQAARNSGVKFGRKVATDPEAVRALRNGGLPVQSICKQLKCSRATVYRALGDQVA